MPIDIFGFCLDDGNEMTQKVSEPVSVDLAYYHTNGQVMPRMVVWHGRTLYHVFSVVTKTLFMRLTLNTDNLHWKLEEISDD